MVNKMKVGDWVMLVVLVLAAILASYSVGARSGAAGVLAESSCPAAGAGMRLAVPGVSTGKLDRVRVDIPVGGGVLTCEYEVVDDSSGGLDSVDMV